MNHQLPTSQHVLLVIMFVLFLATLINTLILLQCYVMLTTIQSDVRIERESVATRQKEIMTRLTSIEICVDASHP